MESTLLKRVINSVKKGKENPNKKKKVSNSRNGNEVPQVKVNEPTPPWPFKESDNNVIF